MTSMLLASAYLGGCYFFLRVLLVERRSSSWRSCGLATSSSPTVR
jgi:hypothetical protein